MAAAVAVALVVLVTLIWLVRHADAVVAAVAAVAVVEQHEMVQPSDRCAAMQRGVKVGAAVILETHSTKRRGGIGGL